MSSREKNIPVRMCCICRTRLPKRNLVRFAVTAGANVPEPDLKQREPGRGVYLCAASRCREAFSKWWAKRKVKGRNL